MTASDTRMFQALLLIFLLITESIVLPQPVHANPPDPVTVTVGQPNIWSLEQAHYLLAQIRERNLGIRNPILSETDLDPNATNANRLDALRTLFEIGVSYDQRLGLTNSLNRQNLELNQTRRQELLARRSALFDQKNGQLEAVGTLQSELNKLEESEDNADAKKQKERELASLKEQIKATDDQLKNVASEIELVGAGSEQLTSPSPQAGPGPFTDGLTNRIGKAITDDFAKDAAKNPRLAASVKLDNYVQMQYELLAKQLTLLRDEVGPNERLVFLELPTSIYSTPERANDWSAQSRWEVTGYYCENKSARRLRALRQQLSDLYTQLQDDSFGKDPFEQLRLLGRYNVQQRGINRAIATVRREFYEDRAETLKRGGIVFGNPDDAGDGLRSVNAASLFELGDIHNLADLALRFAYGTDALSTYFNGQLTPATQALMPVCAATPNDNCRNILTSELNRIILSGINHYSPATFAGVRLSTETRLLATTNPTGEQRIKFNRLLLEDAFSREIAKRRANDVRVIDLIPRQSSLNVSDIKEIVKERGAKFVFSFLMGIGGSVNYQQRRERFEQFQQQEVYASGFGKGEADFGWNFAPMPGTKRLGSGVRTTYAVMVVPRDAARIQLKATGRPFRSKNSTDSEAPTAMETFELDIPNGPSDEGFFVTRIDYPLVAINQRSVVVLRGDFSTQTGILINGTPLTRAVGVASPWFGSERERSNSTMGLGEPDTTIKGFYEVINSNQLVMTFLMPKDFKGTPHITLVSPGRARNLNDLELTINGEPRQQLRNYHEGFMIGAKAKDKETPLTIAGIEISPVRPALGAPVPGYLDANVNLKVDGLKDGAPTIFFNAAQVTPTSIGGGLYHFQVQLPLNLEKISFIVAKGDEVDTEQLDNPVFAKLVVTQNTYEYVDEEDPHDDTVTLVIEGRRIADLEVTITNANHSWKSRSFNQGVLLVKEMRKSPIVVKLKDTLTGEELAPIELYQQRPKQKPKPSNTDNARNRRP